MGRSGFLLLAVGGSFIHQIMVATKHLLVLLLFCLTAIACGGSTTQTTTTPVNETVNTAKLVGTPFEGLTIGDDIPTVGYFLCGKYQTTVITEFPIKVFTAFFTADEEAKIAEGVDIANTAMGFTAYEVTDVWADDVRVIYKVSSDFTNNLLANTDAVTIDVRSSFNDKNYADKESPDWVIFVARNSKHIIAHELGHASGIVYHKLINYENDTLEDLEENSLMTGNVISSSPAMTDYTFMIKKQGELMQQHLGEKGSAISLWCK